MIAAFFDFDGTLYRGHIWSDLAHHHWTARRNRRWVAAYVARNMAPWPLYRLGMMDQTAYYSAWGQTMSWLLRGWSVDEAQTLFERLTEEQVLPNLRNDVLDRMHEHQAQDHLVVVVSGTFSPWLDVVAQRMGIPHSVGTPLEMKNGRYTGRIIPPLCQGPGKPQRLQAYLSEQQLEVDWSRSFAFGDSGPDLALLSQVGHPVAIYPDEVLLGHALARSWPVMGEKSS